MTAPVDDGTDAGDRGLTAPGAAEEAGGHTDADESSAGAGWDAEAYDGSHSFVYEYGEDVVERLDPAPGERVLDLGCGTAHLTERIEAAGAEVVGLDRSLDMLAAARERAPGLALVRGDARRLPFEDAFDAVFSNAAIHWVPEADQDAVLASVASALRPGGRFVAELGGQGNVASVVEAVHAECAARGYVDDTDGTDDASGARAVSDARVALDHPWYFPSVGEYATRLEGAGFEVRFARLFDRPTTLDDGPDGLATWLETFGDELLGPVPEAERDAVVAAVADRLRDDLFRDGSWVADYRRLRVAARLVEG